MELKCGLVANAATQWQVLKFKTKGLQQTRQRPKNQMLKSCNFSQYLKLCFLGQANAIIYWSTSPLKHLS